MTQDELTAIFDRTWKARVYGPPSDGISMFAGWLSENWGTLSAAERFVLVTVGESLYAASKDANELR